MIDTLQEIILDFQENDLRIGVPRRLAVTSLPGKAMVCIGSLPGKAMVCIGVRRSGKSTFMFQTIQHLWQTGVSRQNILYLNFFDDRLHGLQGDTLGLILDAYFSLFPHKKHREKVYCFFDEIQMVQGWEPFVDRLMRTEKCEVYITGSSARMLSREVATQMRGRALSWEMFPFSLREFLDFKNIKSQGPLSGKKRLTIQKAFDEYWETGGFPEVLPVDRRLRIKIHQEYWGAMLFRDIVERYDVSHPRAVADLAHWLVDNTSSLYSINNLTGYLKSLGHKAPKSAVSNFLKWFEDAYMLFTVRIFHASHAKANANPKKIYCIDHALVRSIGSGILVNTGHLLENLVFMALRRKTSDIFYFKTQTGREVDFIAGRQGQPRLLVQVCETLAEPKTRKREITALAEAMKEQGLAQGVIVTCNEEEQVLVDAGTITVIPAWKFLLGIDGEDGDNGFRL